MTNPATPMLSRVNATQMNYARRNRMTRTRLKTARSAVRSRPCPPGSPSSAEFASNKGGPPSPVTREVAGSPAVGAHSRSRPTVAGRGRPCVTVEHPVALVRSGRLAHTRVRRGCSSATDRALLSPRAFVWATTFARPEQQRGTHGRALEPPRSWRVMHRPTRRRQSRSRPRTAPRPDALG
jgi:hypothetical protein